MKSRTNEFIMILITIFGMTITVNAQHVNVGVKGGANFFNVINNNSSKYDTKVGFNLGLLGHIHLDRSTALQPELVYSGQGAMYTSNGAEYKLNLGYINVPLLLQYMFDNGFRLQAGPQVGFLTKATTESNDNSISVKENFNTVDFAIDLGVSYVKPSTGFGIDIRYNSGLSNINKNTSSKSFNRGFQLGVFYLIDHH